MGLGLLWILYAGWWSGMRVIFILQFLCVMSGIYWHLTRRGAHCAPANLRQHRTIPALRLKHRSGSCGTASALPKCSIMSGCGTRIVLRGQKPLALCDRCPCFGSLLPPLAALTFAASSIICAFGLAAAAPRSPYRHLELCGIALNRQYFFQWSRIGQTATGRCSSSSPY